MNEQRPAGPPFLSTPAYTPVLEERTEQDLHVVGAVPPELCGTYLRNGPNPRSGKSPAWFAGEGMLHGVHLEGGRVTWYRNRWMRVDRAPNTSVVRHAGRILALVETQLPIEVDAELETVGRFTFGAADELRNVSAHPKTCPTTGELLFVSYRNDRPDVTFYRVDPAGHVVHRAPIRVPAATYMHDIGITSRFAVLWDMPVLVDDWRSPMPLRWSDGYRARIGVVPRDGQDGDVVWFDVQPAMISHTMNAFEDGDRVVLDVTRGPGLWKPLALCRYTLDLRTGEAKEETIDPAFVEFPRIHPAVEGKAYRYGYGVELAEWSTGNWQHTLPKQIDLHHGTARTHDFGPQRMAGECVVAPRPGAAAEDDAWVLTLVYDRARDASDLVILDARNFDGEPVATVRLPCRVPVGLHGAWLPDAPPRG